MDVVRLRAMSAREKEREREQHKFEHSTLKRTISRVLFTLVLERQNRIKFEMDD